MKLQKFTLKYKLTLGITVNIVFTIFEFAIGIFSGSLALIADAAHNLTDVLSLIVSFIGHTLSQRKPTAHKTYGFGRASVLAALINAFILLAIACSIFYCAYKKIGNPDAIQGGIVMLIGLLGILVNGGIALLFIKDKRDLNIHSSLINMSFDALASAAALITGLVIMVTGYTFIDIITSVCLALLLCISSGILLARICNLLLEGVPAHIKIQEITNYLTAIQDIVDIHDLHVWALSIDQVALSCHVVLNEKFNQDQQSFKKNIKELLFQEFGIHHATLELEFIQCTQAVCSFSKVY